MATLIKTDGTETTVQPANGRCFTLDELQRFVGGYIELIALPDGREMYINEEGKFDGGLPLNLKATLYAQLAGIAESDYVVGNCVLGLPQEFNELGDD